MDTGLKNDRSLGRFAINLVANIGNFVLASLIGIWFIPYLIHSLGIAAYGLIPLATTITSYMAIITFGVNSATGRFLTITLNQNDDEKSNIIFNNSLLGSIALVLVLFLPSALLVYYADDIIQVPIGFESQAQWLLVCTIIAFFINTIKTPFDISSFSRNRFDLRNLVSIIELFVRVGSVVVFFWVVGRQVWYVGLGIVLGVIASFAGSFTLWRILTPNLHIRLRSFDLSVFRSLANTSGWVVLNTIGSILFIGIDLIVVNRLFGAEMGGRYAAILQWPNLLRGFASIISGIFAPTILYYYAEKNIDGLVYYACNAVKFLGIFIALPVGLVIGFSKPLLFIWLGKDFITLSPLLVLMVAPLCINLAILPLLSLQLAVNKVKIPGLVTLAMGITNLILALLLAGSTRLGLYGVALAGAIVLSAKNLIFIPVYAAHVLGQSYRTFYKGIFTIISFTLLVTGTAWLISFIHPIENWITLSAAGLFTSIFYVFIIYFTALSSKEKNMLSELLHNLWNKDRPSL